METRSLVFQAIMFSYSLFLLILFSANISAKTDDHEQICHKTDGAYHFTTWVYSARLKRHRFIAQLQHRIGFGDLLSRCMENMHCASSNTSSCFGVAL